MVTKRPRPNVYVSSADLSHRLTLNALTPRPPQMTEADRIMRDLDRGDRIAWGAFYVVLALWAGLAWWAW